VGEKDRWHRLADLIQDSGLPASDKSVYRFLLDRADYKSAELPAKFTPTRKTIARKTSLSYSQVGYSTRHLERHGWLKTSGKHGPGHPITYALTAGTGCDCTGRVHVAAVTDRSATAVAEDTTPDQPRWQCVAAVADVTGSAGDGLATVPAPASTANGWQRTLPTNTANAAGQTALSTERQREGEVVRERDQKQRDGKTSRLPPDWLLIRQVVRIVQTRPAAACAAPSSPSGLGCSRSRPSCGKRSESPTGRRRSTSAASTSSNR
jgi:hypothetical protein